MPNDGLLEYNPTIKELPSEERPRERLEHYGAAALSTAELLAIILRTGTSPDYARKRVKEHLLRFTRIYEQLTSAQIDPEWLHQVEWRDNLLPDVDYSYWR